MSQDEDEFWENPPRLDKLGFPGTVVKSDERIVDEDSPYRSRSSFFVLGDPDDDSAPTATVLRIPPGYGLPYHAHSCDIFMLVLKGTLHVPGRVLKPGDGQFARAHEFYGPEVAGPEGCTRVEFFADLEGATSVEYRLPDGELHTWNSLVDGQAPWRMGMESYPELLAGVLDSLKNGSAVR